MQLGRPEWPCSIEAFKVSIRAWQSVNPVPLPVLYSYNTSKRAYRATVHRRLRGGGGDVLFPIRFGVVSYTIRILMYLDVS